MKGGGQQLGGLKKTVYAGQSTIRFDDPEENEISESYVNGENVKK